MTSAMTALMTWFRQHPGLVLALGSAVAAGGCLAQGQKATRTLGAILALLAIVAGWGGMVRHTGWSMENFLFTMFALVSVASGIGMLLQKDPLYATLNFALVVLGVSGLFLLQAAPFLAAAAVIVYAGAIIVTFLFVVMLAQQRPLAGYDRQPNHPLLAGSAVAVLLASLATSLETSLTPTWGARVALARTTWLQPPSPTSRTGPTMPAGVLGLGRTLYSDYLWGVELAGSVLLVATIAAIIIASQRRELVR